MWSLEFLFEAILIENTPVRSWVNLYPSCPRRGAEGRVAVLKFLADRVMYFKTLVEPAHAHIHLKNKRKETKT